MEFSDLLLPKIFCSPDLAGRFDLSFVPRSAEGNSLLPVFVCRPISVLSAADLASYSTRSLISCVPYPTWFR